MKALTYIICLTAILVMSAGMANAALVAEWTFDEGAGSTAHDSAGTNHGTLLNGTGWTSGVSNTNAVSFNGTTSYVDVPDNPSLRFSAASSFTIAFWVMANPSPGWCGEVISKMRTSGEYGYFGYEVRCSGGYGAQFHTESSYQGSKDIDAGPFDAGKWYYVTAVYDNRDMKIYLNGAVKGTGTFTYDTGSTMPDGDLAIGARVWNGRPESNCYFSGKVDDLRIYNEALSGDAIMNLYQTTPEPATLSLLGLGGILLRKRR